eukprot:GHRQ01000188.1.p1 GENE.GHRQ01000188.1~~GHRQ01000188.1.p1  ORF type:complete len:201 (+),score=23.82 GHRQ01000188.1:510-1112(+)
MFVLGTKKFTNNNKTLFFYKFSKKHTKENFKDESNNQKNFKIFYSDNSMCSTALFKGSKFRVKKNLRIMVKRLWFFDKAAPIPGVSSLKKKKRLLSTKYRAFKNIQRLYEIYNKKKIKAFFRLQKKREFSKNWAAILLMESMYQRSFKKRAFTYNSHQRYKLAYSQYTTINGSFVKKLCFVNMRGDFTLTKNVYTTLNIL